MKKGLSILLLFVFLFNVGGYYIVYWGLRYQTDRQLTNRLNANLYDQEETIELKIPVALPYPVQSHDFQRLDGRFEHKGEFFRLIKHKLHKDTLYVVCIRDRETKQLVSTIDHYVQLTQGLPATSPSQKALQFLSKLVKDFCSHSDLDIIHQEGFETLISFGERAETFTEPLRPSLAHPPKH